jgi:hypothetical protein
MGGFVKEMSQWCKKNVSQSAESYGTDRLERRGCIPVGELGKPAELRHLIFPFRRSILRHQQFSCYGRHDNIPP